MLSLIFYAVSALHSYSYFFEFSSISWRPSADQKARGLWVRDCHRAGPTEILPPRHAFPWSFLKRFLYFGRARTRKRLLRRPTEIMRTKRLSQSSLLCNPALFGSSSRRRLKSQLQGVNVFFFGVVFLLTKDMKSACFDVCDFTLQTPWRQNASKGEKFNFRLPSEAHLNPPPHSRSVFQKGVTKSLRTQDLS